MVEGESGILATAKPGFVPTYEPSKRRVTWPNGSRATTYSADKPALLRGPQHHWAWADELAAWRYEDAWDQLRFGLRLGASPRAVVTTTPRPTKIIRDLLKEPGVAQTRGSTFDNTANLARSFLASVISKYKGTTLGRQELFAEVLGDVPGALWTRALCDAAHRPSGPAKTPRVVVAVDPAASANPDTSNETGVVVCALDSLGQGWLLDDRSGIYKPGEWGAAACSAYRDFEADYVVAEANNGGDMVGYVIETCDVEVPVRLVHASRGKRTRAEPIAALYEQGRIKHHGAFAELEDQLCTWLPGEDSPDRLDACVWGFTELMLGGTLIAPVPDLTGLIRSDDFSGL